MTIWEVTDPDGATSTFEASGLADACASHDLFACALAGCPDAFGWTFRSQDTGDVVIPEDVRADIDAALIDRDPRDERRW